MLLHAFVAHHTHLCFQARISDVVITGSTPYTVRYNWKKDEMVWQALKQQCAAEVERVKQKVQHKQRQAARLLMAKAEEEAIKVSPVTRILA